MPTVTFTCSHCNNSEGTLEVIEACEEQDVFPAFQSEDVVEYARSDGSIAIGILGNMHIEKKTHKISFICISAVFGKRDVCRVAEEAIKRRLTAEEIAKLPLH